MKISHPSNTLPDPRHSKLSVIDLAGGYGENFDARHRIALCLSREINAYEYRGMADKSYKERYEGRE